MLQTLLSFCTGMNLFLLAGGSSQPQCWDYQLDLLEPGEVCLINWSLVYGGSVVFFKCILNPFQLTVFSHFWWRFWWWLHPLANTRESGWWQEKPVSLCLFLPRLPTLPLYKPSGRLQPLLVCMVFGEWSPHFGLFLGPTKVNTAGISPFDNDILYVILPSYCADTIMLCLSIFCIYTKLSTLRLLWFSSLELFKGLFIVWGQEL